MKSIDYSQTIIYKLVCKNLLITKKYVGHTTNFRCRKRTHKSFCNTIGSKNYNNQKYIFIRENGGWDNWDMIQIEIYNCKDGNEARARERFWYENLNAELNTRVPNRTHEEWKETNKDSISIQNKIYRETHIENIKEYYEKNKDVILNGKQKYYEKNKDKISARQKEWYEKNRDAINARRKELKAQKKLSLNKLCIPNLPIQEENV